MVLSCRLSGNIPGVLCPTVGLIHPRLKPSVIDCRSWTRFNEGGSSQVKAKKVKNGGSRCYHSRKYAFSGGRDYQLAKSGVDFPPEPFWIHMPKEALRFLKSLLIFLIEQPSQLKYIEWPSFQSTLKTATLTLLLVGLLIIALASVDSTLCYVLSMLSRRRA